jgi:hypothetical protein
MEKYKVTIIMHKINKKLQIRKGHNILALILRPKTINNDSFYRYL